MIRASRSAAGLALATTLLAPTTPAADADDLRLLRRTSDAFASVAAGAMPAVVSVRVERTINVPGRPGALFADPHGLFGNPSLRQFYYHPGTPDRHYQQRGTGSGFLISKDGYILTNHHVIGDADRIVVRTSDGREFSATRIGSDPRTDVAVIRITDDQDFPCLPMGNSESLRVGEWVIAIGNPFELGETLTVGVVSAKGRNRADLADFVDFIQTDAAINPGNSGGPLLNIEGQVIGINSAIYSGDGGYMGIGFAIPIATASAIKDQLVANGRVDRGYLGIRIQEVTPDLAAYFGIDAGGILVSDVEPGSPAERGGLKPEDVILTLDGEDARAVDRFRNRVAGIAPGTAVTLGLLRGGEALTLRLETGTMPGPGVATLVAPQEERVYDKLGLAVEPAADGLLVARVTPEGPAATAGIQQGDRILSANRRAVPDVETFIAAVAESASSRAVLMKVARGNVAAYRVVKWN
jgi:serine protease Do